MKDEAQLRKDYEQYRMFSVYTCTFEEFCASVIFAKKEEQRKYYMAGKEIIDMRDDDRQSKAEYYLDTKGDDTWGR